MSGGRELMRNVWLSLGLVVVWSLMGWTQCTEVPYTVGGTSVTLRFCGNLAVSGGTCTQPASNVVQCSVPEGSTGTLDITATRTSSVSGTVTISATSLPAGWPGFTPVSRTGAGTVSAAARYQFTVPAGTAGRRFELKFQATTTGVPTAIPLSVILDVRAAAPPPPPGPKIYGPYTGTTDDSGKFTVPIPVMPNTQVTGILTECTVKILAKTPVTIYVATGAPTFGGSGFVWASYSLPPVAQQATDIAYILISAPGYPQVKITQFRIVPTSFFFTTYLVVDVGTISLPHISTPPPPPPPPGPITGRTDSDGRFSVSDGVGLTVSGRLTVCTVTPLPNQTFTLTQVYGEGASSGFTFAVPGYADTTVTKFISVFHLGALSIYNVGDVCLGSGLKPDLKFAGPQCIAVGPERTNWKDFFSSKDDLLVYHESDARLHPDKVTIPFVCEVGVNVWVVNDGDENVKSPFVLRIVLVAPDGRELATKDVKMEIKDATVPPPAIVGQGRQAWELKTSLSVSIAAGGTLPTHVPTLRLHVDAKPDVDEKAEDNNLLEWTFQQAWHQSRSPTIIPSQGWRKTLENGVWLVSDGGPGRTALVLSAKAELPEPRSLLSLRTGVRECTPYWPLAMQYEWNMGDGTRYTTQTVEHRYKRQGRFTITLTTSLGADRRTVTQEVESTDKPVVRLESQYERVFVHGIPVANKFTATVVPNGNRLERIEYILNGRPVQTREFNTDRDVIDIWSCDLGALQPWPAMNRIVVRATARDAGNNVIQGEASQDVRVAQLPLWLSWTNIAMRAEPSGGRLVTYKASYAFPYPPINSTFEIPEWIPILGGYYNFPVKASFDLRLGSDGKGEISGKGEAEFSKKSGDWEFSFKGEVEGKAVVANAPPITLTAGELSGALEGSASKDFDISDVIPAIKGATKIPVVGRAIKWVASRAQLGLGLSLSLEGSVSFSGADPGCCLPGLDCSGAMTLTGTLGLGLTVDLVVLGVNAYGGAKLTAGFTAPGKNGGFLDFNSLVLTGTLGVKLSLDLLLYEAEEEFSTDLTFTLKSPGQGFVKDSETEWTIPIRPYATPNYSTFRGQLKDLPELGTTEMWLVEEVFPHAQPTLVRDAGFALVAWTTDDLAKPFPIGREITYSTGSSTATLGKPRLVTNNQLPDSRAALALDWTGNPVSVWVQHVSPPSKVPQTKQDIAPGLFTGLEIVYARYDRRTAAWSAPVRLTNNAFLDHSPRFLYDARGITGVIWPANTHGELFPDTGTPDTVYLARWDGQGFQSPQVLRTGDTSLMRAFADLGGRILCVWAEDTDGDWGTSGDEELLWATWDGARWSAAERLTKDRFDDQWPVLFPTGIGRADLLWVRTQPGTDGREGVLLSRSFGPDGWTAEQVLHKGRRIFSFQAAQAKDGRVAVVWQELSVQGPDLFATLCKPGGGECTEPRQLTSDPHQESQLALVFGDGVLTLTFLRTTVEEQTKKVRYTGPDLEDPTIHYQDKEFEITAPMPGATHLYLLEVELP